MTSSFPTVEGFKNEGTRAFDRGRKIFTRAADQAGQMAREAGGALQGLREEARHELYETRKTIEKNPLLSVGIGIACGAALGAILGYAVSKIDWSSSDVEERFI